VEASIARGRVCISTSTTGHGVALFWRCGFAQRCLCSALASDTVDSAGEPRISESCLQRWLKIADVEDGVKPGETQAETSELR
jgi:hypothetical protein